MNAKMIMAIVLGILVVLSVVQAFQLKELKEEVSGGGFSVTGADSVGQRGASGAATLPSNIQNLPQMVGGC